MTPRTSVTFYALVAALGGLLFGFDTAVFSGTTDALQRVFAFFAAMMFLQFLFALRLMPETKGFSLEALQTRLGMGGDAPGAVPAATPAAARTR